MKPPPEETILSFCARLKLAEDLGLPPQELDYIGPMELLPGQRLECFNILRPGPLQYSTRSVRV